MQICFPDLTEITCKMRTGTLLLYRSHLVVIFVAILKVPHLSELHNPAIVFHPMLIYILHKSMPTDYPDRFSARIAIRGISVLFSLIHYIFVWYWVWAVSGWIIVGSEENVIQYR